MMGEWETLDTHLVSHIFEFADASSPHDCVFYNCLFVGEDETELDWLIIDTDNEPQISGGVYILPVKRPDEMKFKINAATARDPTSVKL